MEKEYNYKNRSLLLISQPMVTRVMNLIDSITAPPTRKDLRLKSNVKLPE